tara:strand:- start:223 stop:510 length:288 start_codon:yes stop_codon:yes gene_type:complete
MPKRNSRRLSKRRAYSKKIQSRSRSTSRSRSRRLRSRSTSRSTSRSRIRRSRSRRMQKGSGWAGWVCPSAKPNPFYSRAHQIPLISEMGDHNPYV